MPHGFKAWSIFAVAQVALTVVWKIAIKLAENALVGWGDDQIAAWLGITSPRAVTVFVWAIPFALGGITLWLYHLANKKWFSPVVPTGDIARFTGYVSSPSLPQQPDEQNRRRKLIREARTFVVDTCREEGKNTDFRQAAETYAPYFELRPYLSETFRKKMSASRTIFINADGSNLPALATWFLEELDRLEKEWGLRE